jgi:NAD-dependent glycerol-3-phosphate dehydrogenase N-terminus
MHLTRLLSVPTLSGLPQFPHKIIVTRVPLARSFFPPSNPVYIPTKHTHTYNRAFSMPSSSPSPKSKVLVLGSGNFGSCLADHLGDSEHKVFMWSRDKTLVEYFNQHHKNPQYLKDHCFPNTICAVGPDLPDADFVKKMDVLLFAIPTQGLRYFLFICIHVLEAHMYDSTQGTADNITAKS